MLLVPSDMPSALPPTRPYPVQAAEKQDREQRSRVEATQVRRVSSRLLKIWTEASPQLAADRQPGHSSGGSRPTFTLLNLKS